MYPITVPGSARFVTEDLAHVDKRCILGVLEGALAYRLANVMQWEGSLRITAVGEAPLGIQS
eukprot:704199-Amorphochlora_amoeboformis.AAC.1